MCFFASESNTQMSSESYLLWYYTAFNLNWHERQKNNANCTECSGNDPGHLDVTLHYMFVNVRQPSAMFDNTQHSCQTSHAVDGTLGRFRMRIECFEKSATTRQLLRCFPYVPVCEVFKDKITQDSLYHFIVFLIFISNETRRVNIRYDVNNRVSTNTYIVMISHFSSRLADDKLWSGMFLYDMDRTREPYCLNSFFCKQLLDIWIVLFCFEFKQIIHRLK